MPHPVSGGEGRDAEDPLINEDGDEFMNKLEMSLRRVHEENLTAGVSYLSGTNPRHIYLFVVWWSHTQGLSHKGKCSNLGKGRKGYLLHGAHSLLHEDLKEVKDVALHDRFNALYAPMHPSA